MSEPINNKHSKPANDIHPMLLLVILGVLNTLTPFSIDMYLSTFGQIAEDLHTTVTKVSLSLSTYFVGMSLGQILYGPFLDRFGRKPPLCLGIATYIVATLLCITSKNIESLLFFRFLQALGGCAAQVAALAMVRDFYSQEEGAKVFSKMMLILSVSPMLAPTVGAWVAKLWGWEAIFLSLAAIAVIILVTIIFILPEAHQPDETVLLNPVMIAKEFLVILRNPQFYTYTFAGAFSFAGLFSYLAGSSPLLMDEFALTKNQFGLVFAGLSVGMIGGGQLNIFLSRWFTSEQIFATALKTQLGIALIFFAGSTLQWFNLPLYIAGIFLFIACVGLTYPNSASLAMVPFKRNAGSAASLLGFLQTGVGALCSACFGFLAFPPAVAMSIIFVFASFVALGVLLLGKR